jgi:outer membrane protein assembly factor BamB
MGVVISGDTVFATLWHYVTRLGGASEAWLVAIDRISGEEIWRVRMPYQGAGTLVWAPPVVYRNLVIVHTLSARTYAIDRLTQKVAWQFVADSAWLTPTSGAELYGDVLYVDGGDSQIHALRPSDGTVIWNAPFPTQSTTDLLATEKRIYVVNGTAVYILDRASGVTVAVAHQPGTYDPLFSSAAAFANGLVFITVADAAWCFYEP